MTLQKIETIFALGVEGSKMKIAEFCRVDSTAKKDELVKGKAYRMIRCSDGRYAPRDCTYPTTADQTIANSGVTQITKADYAAAKVAEAKGKGAVDVGGITRVK